MSKVYLTSSTKKAIAFTGSVTAYLLLFTMLITSYAGNNPLNKLNINVKQYVSLFPQGWAFFTKSPKEITVSLYEVKNNFLEKVDFRGFKKEYAFGFSRKNRISSIEVNTALKKLNQNPQKISFDQTIIFRDDLNKYIKTDTLVYNKVSKDEKNILLQGKYLLVLEDFLPWSLVRKKDSFPVKQHIKIIPFSIN